MHSGPLSVVHPPSILPLWGDPAGGRVTGKLRQALLDWPEGQRVRKPRRRDAAAPCQELGRQQAPPRLRQRLCRGLDGPLATTGLPPRRQKAEVTQKVEAGGRVRPRPGSTQGRGSDPGGRHTCGQDTASSDTGAQAAVGSGWPRDKAPRTGSTWGARVCQTRWPPGRAAPPARAPSAPDAAAPTWPPHAGAGSQRRWERRGLSAPSPPPRRRDQRSPPGTQCPLPAAARAPTAPAAQAGRARPPACSELQAPAPQAARPPQGPRPPPPCHLPRLPP